jgi:hypothetical protein
MSNALFSTILDLTVSLCNPYLYRCFVTCFLPNITLPAFDLLRSL